MQVPFFNSQIQHSLEEKQQISLYLQRPADAITDPLETKCLNVVGSFLKL